MISSYFMVVSMMMNQKTKLRRDDGAYRSREY